MEIKKIICFGDSFTLGQGFDTLFEEKLYEKYDKKTAKQIANKFRKKYSWVSYLSKKIKCENLNFGESGISNTTIINNVINYHKNNKIEEGDFFIIMWSSGLRNELPIFPKTINDLLRVGIGFSYKQLLEDKLKSRLEKTTYFSLKTDDSFYLETLEKFHDFFVKKLISDDVFDFSMINFLNYYYIYFLQEYFNFFNINYLMCDAFESMFSYEKYSNISKNLKMKIDYQKYFNSKQKFNFYDWLKKEFDDSYFEGYGHLEILGNHPNKKGYEEIANLLYKHLKKN